MNLERYLLISKGKFTAQIAHIPRAFTQPPPNFVRNPSEHPALSRPMYSHNNFVPTKRSKLGREVRNLRFCGTADSISIDKFLYRLLASDYDIHPNLCRRITFIT